MPKTALLLIALTVVILTGILTIIFNASSERALPKSEIDKIVNQAKFVYLQRKMTGEDLSSGPCLSDALLPGWVLDIAHNPREPIDDIPANQCPSYRNGASAHFVELDPEGNLIRAK